MKIRFNTTNKSLVPKIRKMSCASAYEIANCHIKCRDLENHYWICKYQVTTS